MKQKLLNKLWLRVGMIVAIMTTALSGTVWADSVTFNYSDYKGQGTQGTGSSCTMNNNDVSITNTKFYGNTSYAHFYANGTTTITPAANVTITQIVLTATSTSYNGYQSSGTITASKGEVSSSGTTVTWTGSATEAFTLSNNKQIRWTSVVVTYTSTGGTPTCATPTFSPAAGAYTSAQSVIISSETSDATIYYTTDGTDPTTSSSTYSSAISVSTNTTIKAMAVKAGMDNSSVASAKYVFTENAGTADNPYTVAEARALIDAGVGTQNVYVAGIVSEIVTAYNSQYENISFNISDDGETSSDQLEVFRCVSSTGADASEVIVNDNVVVKGNLKKFNSTYEFDAACTLESLTHPAVPTIIVGPTTLANFTYEVGDGPSTAKNIAVSGLNLTTDFTLSLGESSNFEMSLAEASGYTNSLTLTQTSGAVAETTIYVRMKAGLDADDYEGTITISSTGATSQTVSLSGSVTAPEAAHVTWDLSTDSYESGVTANLITWTSNYATMTNTKGTSGTAVNNYIPTTRTSTRMYNGNVLTITPASGYAITSVVFTATTESYASALQGSTWTNATATASGSTVTVTPADGSTAISAAIGGTCGFTEVKVYYETYVAPAAAPVWSALPTPNIYTGAEYELDLTAYVTGNPDPSISLTSSSAAANDYTFTDGQLSFTPSSAGTYTFSFTATNTEGSANATLTVTAENPEGTPYTLATTITSGKHYIIVNKESGKAMGAQNDNNRAAVGVTVAGQTAYVSSADVQEFVIYGPDADGLYTIYDGTGYLYAASSSSNNLKTEATVDDNARWEITFSNGVASIKATKSSNRNVMQYNSNSALFACYATASQTAVYLYEKAGEETPEESVTVGSAGYTTYVTQNPVSFPTGVKGYVVTEVGETSMHLEEVTDAPAREPLVIKADAGTYTLGKDFSTGYSSVCTGDTENLLKASDGNVSGGETIFALALKEENVGFFPVSSSINVPAGKAYLVVTAGEGVKGFIFDFGATGIAEPKAESTNAPIYNLAGQRVSRVEKGIYIQNGRKFFVK